MANPKPVIIEGKPESVINAPHGVDLVMPHDVQVTVQSSNALLLDQIAKVAKGKSVTITFQWT
jgi:hypothetical protein